MLGDAYSPSASREPQRASQAVRQHECHYRLLVQHWPVGSPIVWKHVNLDLLRVEDLATAKDFDLATATAAPDTTLLSVVDPDDLPRTVAAVGANVCAWTMRSAGVVCLLRDIVDPHSDN